jgi:hypothetical protein
MKSTSDSRSFFVILRFPPLRLLPLSHRLPRLHLLHLLHLRFTYLLHTAMCIG